VWVKVIIVAAFVGIVASLASGLYYLVNDKGDSRRTLRALTLRIGLSVGLFLFLMILIALGVIEPHGVYPTPPSG
jgi:drug/metabolite transporter (DMT)-like permease